MRQDLPNVDEKTRVNGSIFGSLNSTFIALIPKKDKSKTFSDYKPISLCNMIYKVITKIISNQI